MKASKEFTEIIKSYLEKQAKENPLFASKYDEEKIEDCVTYILNQVEKSGLNGFAEQEIFSMAIHFYEERPDPGERKECRIVSRRTSAEITPEEKEAARKRAMDEEVAKAKESMKKKPVKKTEDKNIQTSLF